LRVEVQVCEEAAKDGSEMVESLSAQEAVKLFAVQKAFYRIPHMPPSQILQGEFKTGVTHVEDTFQKNAKMAV